MYIHTYIIFIYTQVLYTHYYAGYLSVHKIPMTCIHIGVFTYIFI